MVHDPQNRKQLMFGAVRCYWQWNNTIYAQVDSINITFLSVTVEAFFICYITYKLLLLELDKAVKYCDRALMLYKNKWSGCSAAAVDRGDDSSKCWHELGRSGSMSVCFSEAPLCITYCSVIGRFAGKPHESELYPALISSLSCFITQVSEGEIFGGHLRSKSSSGFCRNSRLSLFFKVLYVP